MELLIACGTWVKDDSSRVIEYIRGCEIFPNNAMIAQATGLPEQRVKRIVGSILRQERMVVSRYFLIDFDDDTKEESKTRRDIVIHELMLRGDYGEDIAAFREANRYYDDEGNIRYRFTEEQVRRSIEAFRK